MKDKDEVGFINNVTMSMFEVYLNANKNKEHFKYFDINAVTTITTILSGLISYVLEDFIAYSEIAKEDAPKVFKAIAETISVVAIKAYTESEYDQIH